MACAGSPTIGWPLILRMADHPPAGSERRNLAEVFGKRNTVIHRCLSLIEPDVLRRLFEVVTGDPILELWMIDATSVVVHRHRPDTNIWLALSASGVCEST